MRVTEPEDAVTIPVAEVVVRSAWQLRIVTFLMVFGPGLIVMEADNDAGAVDTYMQAGGQHGLHLLWLLVVLLPICYFIQEMVARLAGRIVEVAQASSFLSISNHRRALYRAAPDSGTRCFAPVPR
jgi:hypothetical protein